MFVCSECGASQQWPGHCGADGTRLSPIGEDILLGVTIGAYRVARLLGIGGMGRVYKGVHPTIGSRVAIKVLSRECSDRRDLVERFFAEAKAVNLIRHESIVNVLDLAVLPDGRPYIIMEYLDGAPLASLIEASLERQKPLPLGGVARLAAEVLDALGAAHAKGIVHRDLKPDNIFVTPAGRPKVLDFGIAKLSDSIGTATRTGSLLGTPHYMSPEQAAGRPVDARADIYAMGIILFECVTGTRPFHAESLFDLLRQHVELPPPSPRARRPDLPPDLERVILTALAKPPEQRFATVQAMTMALQHATSQLSPEQWQPVTSASAHHQAQPTVGWAPTPPASWGGASSASPPGAPPVGHPSTVSAGQVTPGSEPRTSRKGPWLAIVALLVIGGGVTAAVVATGDGTGGSKVTSASALAGGSEPAKLPAPDRPARAPSAEAAPAEQGEEGDDPDVDPAMADSLAQLETAMKYLPPDQRKLLGKYRDIMKLPPAERMKHLTELSELGREMSAKLGGAPPRPAAPPPTGPDAGWVTTHDVTPPDFDATHVDVDAFLSYAVAQAKQMIPDAELIWLSASGVYPDGHADLSLVANGNVDVRFFSPSRARRDPKLPLGAKVDWKCEFRVIAMPSGVMAMPIDGWDCTELHPLARPRCSVAAIWNKAIARKKQLAGRSAIAQVGFRENIVSHAVRWFFDVDGVFSDQLADDC